MSESREDPPRDDSGDHGAGSESVPEAAPDASEERAARKLVPLVALEAHRMVSEAAIRPDPRRLAEGWERRFITDGTRAEEAVDLYRQLGYEVVADPVRPQDLAGECEACRLVAMMSFKSIYTRRPARDESPGSQENPE